MVEHDLVAGGSKTTVVLVEIKHEGNEIKVP
jgi:hypothetical protein